MMSILCKVIYRFSAVPYQNPSVLVCFLAEIEKSMLKFIWNLKGPQIVKTILKKKKKAEGLILLHFKAGYKAPVIKMLSWHKSRKIDQ